MVTQYVMLEDSSGELHTHRGTITSFIASVGIKPSIVKCINKALSQIYHIKLKRNIF